MNQVCRNTQRTRTVTTPHFGGFLFQYSTRGGRQEMPESEGKYSKSISHLARGLYGRNILQKALKSKD